MTVTDARTLRNARLGRIAAARDAAGSGPAAEIADVAGCFADQRRDLWIFRNDAFLAHVPYDRIDAVDGHLILGDLRLRLDGSIGEAGDEFDLLLDGVPHSLNAADNFGAGYDALDEVDRLLDAPGVDRVIVRVDGGEPVLLSRADVSTRGPDVPSLVITDLGVSIPFHAIGHRGLVVRGEDLVILGLSGTTVVMTPVVGHALQDAPNTRGRVKTRRAA